MTTVDPVVVSGLAIDSGFQDWSGCPPHLFGASVGRPLNTWTFTEVYAATGKVIVRDDLFEGTVGVPYSFKTHSPGQVIATWTLSQLASQSIATTGTPYNAVMNGVMLGVAGHSAFIGGSRIYYPLWRARSINRHRDTGALLGRCYVGGGVGPTGASLNTSIITPYSGTYYMNIEVNINLPPGNIFADHNFQLEVGFGSVQNAFDTATVVAASPEWPAYTQGINTTTV